MILCFCCFTVVVYVHARKCPEWETIVVVYVHVVLLLQCTFMHANAQSGKLLLYCTFTSLCSFYWLNIGFNKKKSFCTQICVFVANC